MHISLVINTFEIFKIIFLFINTFEFLIFFFSIDVCSFECFGLQKRQVMVTSCGW